MVSELIIVGITLVSAVIASGAQYLFKKAVPKFNFNIREIWALRKNRMLMAGLIIYVGDLAIYLSALKYGQLSFVYPIFASSFVFTLLISMFVLKEKASWKRVAGILLIVAGIAVVALTY